MKFDVNELIEKIGCPIGNQYTGKFISEPKYLIEKKEHLCLVAPWIVYKENFVMGTFPNQQRAETYIELLKFADKIYEMNHKDI